MRIVYGVHGYGRGHATRALALLPHLTQRHQVLVLAGGDAYSAIWPDYDVVRITTLAFSYGKSSGKRSNWQTLRRNIPAFLDLVLGGPVFEMIRGIVQEFNPDVIISDAEAWTHQVAQSLRIPRISVDHIGILAYCRPQIEWRDRLEACFDTAVYRLLMGTPERIVVSSFYDAPPRRPGVRVVGAMVRPALHDFTPSEGGHLLAYFNQGRWQLNRHIMQTLQECGCPVRLFGGDDCGRDGNITIRPLSNLPFLEDLASCRGVISTAGNQLMGEAIFLGKPVLVMPEACVEQRLNAAAVERLGIGMRTAPRHLTPALVRTFLDRRDEYAANMRRHVRDGLHDAVTAIEEFIADLAPAAGSAQALPTGSK
jgi:uncharacterized protein (TIGR00661 family)